MLCIVNIRARHDRHGWLQPLLHQGLRRKLKTASGIRRPKTPNRARDSEECHARARTGRRPRRDRLSTAYSPRTAEHLNEATTRSFPYVETTLLSTGRDLRGLPAATRQHSALSRFCEHAMSSRRLNAIGAVSGTPFGPLPEQPPSSGLSEHFGDWLLPRHAAGWRCTHLHVYRLHMVAKHVNLEVVQMHLGLRSVCARTLEPA